MKLDRNTVFSTFGVVIGVGMLGVTAYTVRSTAETNQYPEGLLAVTPAPTAQTSQQSELLVDLEVGYTGRLFLDGVEIPLDQLQFDANNFGLVYPCRAKSVAPTDPGATRDAETTAWPECTITASDKVNLPKNNVTAAVEFWKIGDEKNTRRRFAWSFRTY
jgi:hypothetical protein